MKNLDKLKNSLPKLLKLRWSKEAKEFDEIFELPHTFVRDEMLYISGEYGDNAMDYYGDFNNGYAWINPVLEAWAKKNKGYWEWENAGAIVFNKA